MIFSSTNTRGISFPSEKTCKLTLKVSLDHLKTKLASRDNYISGIETSQREANLLI